MSEIRDVMEEAEELLTRYAGAVPSTWERNLDVIGTLMVVRLIAQGPDCTVGELMREAGVFLRAAWRMGVDGGSVMGNEADGGLNEH